LITLGYWCCEGHVSFWACCTAPPRKQVPKQKKEKKPKEKKEKKKKEKKTKKGAKTSEQDQGLPIGFKCNGGDSTQSSGDGGRLPATGPNSVGVDGQLLHPAGLY
jgi:hypothetical protein